MGVVAVVAQTITNPQEAPILVRELDTGGVAGMVPQISSEAAAVVRRVPPTGSPMRLRSYQPVRVQVKREQQMIMAQV